MSISCANPSFAKEGNLSPTSNARRCEHAAGRLVSRIIGHSVSERGHYEARISRSRVNPFTVGRGNDACPDAGSGPAWQAGRDVFVFAADVGSRIWCALEWMGR